MESADFIRWSSSAVPGTGDVVHVVIETSQTFKEIRTERCHYPQKLKERETTFPLEGKLQESVARPPLHNPGVYKINVQSYCNFFPQVERN